MSVPVDLARLDEAMGDFDDGYLLSVAVGGGVKAVSATVEISNGGVVVKSPGNGSTRNIAAHPTVTLMFPPRSAGGYTLLIDGAAEIRDGAAIVTPARAVLHRPIAGAESDQRSCGHDCQPL